MRCLLPLALLTGCTPLWIGHPPGDPPPPEPRHDFALAMRRMADFERAGWNERGCREVVELFLRGDESTTATYNAATTHRRCGDLAKARALYEQILVRDPRFHRARVQLALVRLEEDGDVGRAIAELKRAVADARFRNEEALVHLARLQIDRGALASARLNIARAMVVSPDYMPAHNAHAIHQLARAKRAVGRTGDAMRVDVDPPVALDPEALAMAQHACDRAREIDDTYAPIHNTCGIIDVEAGSWREAAQRFQNARRLDPQLFVAHFNYASVHLRLRSFAPAERAFRAAIALDEGDYDAQLGLALALRGQTKVADAEKALAAAKAIDPARPEYYFNRGVLLLELGQPRSLEVSVKMFRTFIEKAGEDLAYIESVEVAKQRIHWVTRPCLGPPHPWDL